MFQGKLIGIYLTARATEKLHHLAQVEALAGRGLAGDRYCTKEGTFSAKEGVDREVTLIESEALMALQSDYGITLMPAQARRNLLTQDVPLNHLVGKEFRVGEVLLRGIRLCEPCKHLEKLTVEGVMRGLAHRGGLRAQILGGGKLQVGDSIGVLPPRG
jgi:MOSC domain-containing protein YiiM